MEYKILKRLFAAAREQGVDKDMLHELAMSEFKKDSLKKLTDRQGLALIDRLGGKKLYYGSARGMATDRQKRYILYLAHSIGWGDNPARLAGFMKKYAGTEDLNRLTFSRASSIIEGMKRIGEGQ